LPPTSLQLSSRCAGTLCLIGTVNSVRDYKKAKAVSTQPAENRRFVPSDIGESILTLLNSFAAKRSETLTCLTQLLRRWTRYAIVLRPLSSIRSEIDRVAGALHEWF